MLDSARPLRTCRRRRLPRTARRPGLLFFKRGRRADPQLLALHPVPRTGAGTKPGEERLPWSLSYLAKMLRAFLPFLYTKKPSNPIRMREENQKDTPSDGTVSLSVTPEPSPAPTNL